MVYSSPAQSKDSRHQQSPRYRRTKMSGGGCNSCLLMDGGQCLSQVESPQSQRSMSSQSWRQSPSADQLQLTQTAGAGNGTSRRQMKYHQANPTGSRSASAMHGGAAGYGHRQMKYPASRRGLTTMQMAGYDHRRMKYPASRQGRQMAGYGQRQMKYHHQSSPRSDGARSANQSSWNLNQIPRRPLDQSPTMSGGSWSPRPGQRQSGYQPNRSPMSNRSWSPQSSQMSRSPTMSGGSWSCQSSQMSSQSPTQSPGRQSFNQTQSPTMSGGSWTPRSTRSPQPNHYDSRRGRSRSPLSQSGASWSSQMSRQSPVRSSPAPRRYKSRGGNHDYSNRDHEYQPNRVSRRGRQEVVGGTSQMRQQHQQMRQQLGQMQQQNNQMRQQSNQMKQQISQKKDKKPGFFQRWFGME